MRVPAEVPPGSPPPGLTPPGSSARELKPQRIYLPYFACGVLLYKLLQAFDLVPPHAFSKMIQDYRELMFLLIAATVVSTALVRVSGIRPGSHDGSSEETLKRLLVLWAANKSFEISKVKFKFPRARTFELFRARSRLHRSQILQVNTRWKALAEIYTMHSFAPFSNIKIFVKHC